MISRGEIRVHVAESFQHRAATHGFEGEVGGDQTAANQADHLQHIRPGYRGQASIDGIDACDDEEQDDNQHPDGHCKVTELNSQSLESQDLFDSKRAQPGDGSQVHKDVQEQPQDREGQTDPVIVALPQELRNREDLLLQHDGEEKLPDHDQSDRGHYLVGSRCDAVAVAGT